MPNTMIDLGERIRKERQKRKLTLEKFSNMTGLSKSFLSQIERGVTEPSITSLKKIAGQFGYSVINLFSSGNSDENWGFHEKVPELVIQKPSYVEKVSVVRADKRKRLALPGSKVVYDLLTPDMNRQMEVMSMRVSQGENSGDEPMLDSPGEKICIVMKGTLEVKVGNDTYQLNEGDSLHYPAHVPHSWLATKGDVIEVFWILTPPSF
ncbi:MAG: helix-turn-helix transcriptional regulator [SAR324 cluster bacterium]|nr:helix-turn-helix transcriptional regulator [SAR324 cluster bacterium]